MLLLSIHHIVADGWSLGVLVRELSASTPPRARDGPRCPRCRFSTPTTRPGSASGCQGEVLERQLAYWREQLAGRPACWSCRPTGRARRSRPIAGRSWRSSLDPELVAELQRLRPPPGGDAFMTLLAAFQALLAATAGRRTIVVGTPIANRTRRQTEGLIGFFVNTLVLRTDLAGDPTFRELLAGCARRRWGPTRTRTCPSSSWSRSCSRSATEPAAVPGDVRPAERARRRGAALRAAAAAGRRSYQHRQVRPHADLGGDGRRAGGRASSTAPTCSTRPPSAHGRHFADAAGRHRRRSRPAALACCRC